MAQPGISPISPNPGNLESAIAASQAVVFTATDRKVIEERSGGEIRKSGSFLEAMFENQTITHKVENEQTTVHPPRNTTELASRIAENNHLMKRSTILHVKERVDISGSDQELKLASDIQSEPPSEKINGSDSKPHSEIIAKTAAIAKELNLDPAELFDKFALEQSQLYSLVTKIKELHLKRLLSGNQLEFISLSEEIKLETLASAREEARDWLSRQLDGLTRVAAEYKLNLEKSLRLMHYEDKQDDSVHWLQKIIDKLA